MRYYSSTAGEMILQLAVTAGDTTITVDTTAGLPVTFPYALFLDHGSGAEEIVDVTGAAGTTLTVTRGRDGTVAQSHAFGAKIRHGISARDLREAREHEAATGAHGVTEVVGADEAQTLDNKTFEPAADNTAITLRDRSGNTAPLLAWRNTSDSVVMKWLDSTVAFLAGASELLRVRTGSASFFYKEILGLRVSDDVHSVVGTVVPGATGRFLRLMLAASELFSVAANGDLKARAGTFTSSVGVTGDVTASGNVNGANITTLTSDVATAKTDIDNLEAADVALDTRVDALEADTGVITAAAAGFTAASGFTGLSGSVRRRGNLVSVDVAVTTTNTLGTGDIANTLAVNVPAGYRPSVRAGLVGSSVGDGLFAFCDTTAGITIGATNLSYAAGSTVTIAGVWVL